MRPKRQNTHREGLADHTHYRSAKCRTNKKSVHQRLKEILSHTEAYDYEWKCRKYAALEGLVPDEILCKLLDNALTSYQIRLLCENKVPEWKVTLIIDIYKRK